MRLAWISIGCLLAATASASTPADFAKQWPTTAEGEGAYTVVLDEALYRSIRQADLSDLAAFNAAGEALPFGPMPASFAPPTSVWREAKWFSLPAAVTSSDQGGDLHMHASRDADGNLQLDATLSSQATKASGDLLIDVQAGQEQIEAIEFEFAEDAADFSAEVSVDASDDLQSWNNLAPAATVALLRQNGATLQRRRIDLPATQAAYLRVTSRNFADVTLPVSAVRLRLRRLSLDSRQPDLQWIDAEASGRDGRAFVYRLPARVRAEQLDIRLADDNAVATFDVFSRDGGQGGWNGQGELTAFHLRGAGVSLDNEPLDLSGLRSAEWRLESATDFAQPPKLRFAYRPESWLLLTHGAPPYTVVAGSARARRDSYPIDALVAQVRQKYGSDWRPARVKLGSEQVAGGESALQAPKPDRSRTWILWTVLLVGAGLVIGMVLQLLRRPPDDS